MSVCIAKILMNFSDLVFFPFFFVANIYLHWQKRKSNFPHMLGNSEWSRHTVYEEGLPNMWGNAQIIPQICGGRYDFATAKLWISLYMRKIWFFFISLVFLSTYHKWIKLLFSGHSTPHPCTFSRCAKSVGHTSAPIALSTAETLHSSTFPQYCSLSCP